MKKGCLVRQSSSFQLLETGKRKNGVDDSQLAAGYWQKT